jgi:glycosyltransferase involved in cell wall biosynthesis
MKRISYILPVHNEASNVNPLYSALDKALKQIADDYAFEFIFINDGSTDDSLAKLYELQKHDKRVVVINFARNFGHQMAVTAGLDYTKADAAIIMDSDLQDPPEVSLQLIRQWEAGFKVVYAQRRTRQDSFLKKLSANIFYRTLRRLAEIDIPRNTGDFRLIDRKVVDVLGQFREHNRFLRGLVSYVGFRQTAVLFDRDKRHAGETSYPLSKMLKFAGDGILSFSVFPLKLMSRLGYTFSALSFIGIIYAIVVKLLDPSTVVPGWTFIVIAILLVGGMQLIMLGLLGSYIGRIYTESQNRPLYIIESVTDSKNN